MFDNDVQQIMKYHKVHGLSLIVIENGEILTHKHYGIKDSRTNQIVDGNTVFESASLSKPVFAYAVLLLVEKGLLNLDTPLVEYLPCADVKDDPRVNLITARMVLSHTTGFPNWRPENEGLKIHFNPGDKFNYSGEGFFYLQKVVEHLTGMPVDEFLKMNVLDPLGMMHSSYIWQDEYDVLKATGHDINGVPIEAINPKTANVAYTLLTTGLDYAKFVIACINNVGLRPETVNEMLSSQIMVGVDGPSCLEINSNQLSKDISWGLGWGLQKIAEGAFFWHWGDNACFKCYISGSQDGMAIVIFTNSDNGLKAISEIVCKISGLNHPAFAWLDYK